MKHADNVTGSTIVENVIEDDGFSLRVFPEILACIRQGDVDELRQQERLVDWDTYYHQAIPDTSKIQQTFFIMIGVCLAIACEGGLPLERGYTLCVKYQQKAHKLESIRDFIDGTQLMLREFTAEVHESYRNGDPLLDRCYNYIARHVYEKIDLADLAQKCRYSLDWLQHVFPQRSGLTLSAAIRREKIRKARFYLTYTDQPCAYIGQRLAYCSQSYFISQFKLETGMTPAQYRRQYKPVFE